MKITNENETEWMKITENDEILNAHIKSTLKINNDFYHKPPYSLENGYGIEILLFTKVDKFIETMINKRLFEKSVEFVENINGKNNWLCLSYLISSDNGIVIYFRTK